MVRIKYVKSFNGTSYYIQRSNNGVLIFCASFGLKELKETGKVKGYEGHHINSVKGHPEDAGDPSNIEFVKKGGEHLSRHNGNYRNPSSGKKINRDYINYCQILHF
ncbi:hypothetical protein [Hoylesella timonensis]|uniref:hypothetical protein n=1 Tax=Hoylesella timonensis TaxID=386414 RepID=UPI0012FDEB15|nr:hypothetical protein [Hoylesella timonensis]